MTPRALLLVLLAACSPGPTVVALALSADDSCREDHYLALASVSVEVYGDADGELCTLARRCVTVDAPADVADLEAALRAATQPLVDLGLAGTRQIAVYGHQRLGCGAGARDLCGFADLADEDDGALTIPIRCDAVDLERCPGEVPPFCP
jgi:hypothetical protein